MKIKKFLEDFNVNRLKNVWNLLNVGGLYNMPIINSKIGKRTKIWYRKLVNIFRCEIGKDCNIAAFVEIGSGVVIGDRCSIAAFSFIPNGVIIEDNVFIGPNTVFTNDRYPPADKKMWVIKPTIVKKGASIGAGSLILPGVIIGENARVGAGAVVTRDVKPNTKVKGVPARIYNVKN